MSAYRILSVDDRDSEGSLSGAPDDMVGANVGVVDSVAAAGSRETGEGDATVNARGGLGGGDGGVIGSAKLQKNVSYIWG